MPRPFPLLWLCLSFAALLHAEPQTVTGRCVGVHDGDSSTVLATGNVQHKVGLEGIGAPELKQPFSQQSKVAMSEIVFGKAVTLKVTGKDHYGQTLAVVMVAGVNANLELSAVASRGATTRTARTRNCWQRRTPQRRQSVD